MTSEYLTYHIMYPVNSLVTRTYSGTGTAYHSGTSRSPNSLNGVIGTQPLIFRVVYCGPLFVPFRLPISL